MTITTGIYLDTNRLTHSTTNVILNLSSRTVCKVLFFILFVIVCFSQCYIILKGYLVYPTIINMYDVSPSLITILPAITICNNNRLSLKKIADRNLTIRRALEDRFPGWYRDQPFILDQNEFNSFRDEVARIFDRLEYDPQRDMDNSTVNQSYFTRPDPRNFIKWIGCGQTWNDSIDCGNVTQIDSVRSRICTTFLHRGAMLHDALNRPEIFNSSQPGLPREHTYFDAKEVIKIVVNFIPEDYGDLKRQIGARIIFHDNNFVASSGELDFFITRGYRYDFNIARKDVKSIGEPYSQCYDYDKLNLGQFKERIDPRVPLTSATCLQNCIARNIVYRSKCWPPTMPYFRNDSLDPNLNLKACPWFKKTHHISIFNELLRMDELKRKEQYEMEKNNSIIKDGNSNQNKTSIVDEELQFKTKKPPPNKNMKFYKMIRRNCMAQCVLACKMTDYSVSMTRSAWPNDLKILFDKTGESRRSRHCCALIAIKFTHFHYQVHEYQPKYDLANTIGDVGGLLAFWLGLSIVSVYHALHKLIEFCSRRLGRASTMPHQTGLDYNNEYVKDHHIDNNIWDSQDLSIIQETE